MLERDPHDAQGALGRLERGADDDLNELLARPGVGSPEAQLQIDPDRVEQRRAANRRPPLELSEVGEQVCRAARPEGGPEFVGVRRGSALGVGARVEEQLVGQGIRHEPAERSAGEDGLPKRFPGALATFAAGEKPAADDGLQWGVRGRVRQPARAPAVLAGG